LLGPDHPEVALALSNLAAMYLARGDAQRAGALWRRALAMREKQVGLDHPDLAKTLDDYAGALRMLNRQAEAATLEGRANAIRAKPKL
ncbi:MAG: tetratricopeptide repeat protein, partial [Nitrospirota bacterium]|nr:tetratricopeptide repeat protein [Nitrospirota bacterium]